MTGYFAFFGFASYTLTGRGDAERLIGVPVGPQFFEMLGVAPAMGRGFTAQELAPNGPRAALITHATWQRTFAGNAAIVGQTVTLSGQPVTVVGVLPATFDFGSVFVPGTRVDMFVPANYAGDAGVGQRAGRCRQARARCVTGSSRTEFRSLMPRIGTNLGTFRNQTAVITPLEEHVNGRIERSLLVLWGAAGLVLLIACANLAGLLLARTSARSKEIAVRLALGASRSRIVRQIVTESTVLSVIGAGLGVPLAYALVSYLKSLPGLSLPLLHRVEVDGMALLFTAVVAVGSGVAFGLLPARRIASGDSQQSMRDQTRGSTRGRGHARLRSTLVVVEIALACVLLVGAGLLLRTFLRVQAVNLGFAPSQAFAMRVNTSADMDGKARHVLLREMLRRIRNAPGIEAAALSDGLPLDRNRTWSVGPPGREVRPGETPLAFVYITGPEFFKTMGMRLTSGRDLAETDRADSEPVMVVSESLAQALYPAAGRRRAHGPARTRPGADRRRRQRHPADESRDAGRAAHVPALRAGRGWRARSHRPLLASRSFGWRDGAPHHRGTRSNAVSDGPPIAGRVDRTCHLAASLPRVAARRVCRHCAGSRVAGHLQHRGLQRRRTCPRVRRAHGAGRDCGRHQPWRAGADGHTGSCWRDDRRPRVAVAGAAHDGPALRDVLDRRRHVRADGAGALHRRHGRWLRSRGARGPRVAHGRATKRVDQDERICVTHDLAVQSAVRYFRGERR